MNEAIYQRFQEICRQQRWKCTAQRLAVFAYVHDNDDHPDVDDVWREVKGTLPSVTRESIYRILNEFTDRGLLRRLDHVTSARYDCQVGPHGHFLCTRCGQIQDFPLPEPVTVPRGDISGDVEHLELRLTGICKRCRKPQTKTRKPKPAIQEKEEP